MRDNDNDINNDHDKDKNKVKTVTYRLQFIDIYRFMQVSLSNLAIIYLRLIMKNLKINLLIA